MRQFVCNIFSLVFAIFAFVLLFVYLQTHHVWGDVHIEQILINLNEGVSFVSDKTVWGYIVSMALGVFTAVCFSIILKTNKKLMVSSVLICLFVLWQIGVFSYFLNKKIYSSLYEKEYVNPNTLTYTFPVRKRNLIVAYLESAEENYATDLKTNLIENVSAMQKKNLSFEGFRQIQYQDYTIAAMIQSMCGVPYRGSNLKGYEGYRHFLDSLVCYPQILKQNGYETVFMKGADIDFARTGLFMKTHGFDEVSGALELNEKFEYRLEENKGGFGGYHDAALYKMIKEELGILSRLEKPFLLSFITLDTHAPDYFLSPGCAQKKSLKEDAVLCMDKMFADFMKWLEKQPFYENTTVVVLGDHPETGINRLYPKLKNRRVVNFILNPAEGLKKENHSSWTTLDMAPTILNAAGVSFNGAGFGLGRSLFLNEPTLYEKLGHKLETEIFKASAVYRSFETLKNEKTPEYHTYGHIGTDVATPEEIAHFATYAHNVLGVVFLEEMSFRLPQTKKDLTLNVTFKTLLTKKQKRNIRVFANGKLAAVWQVSAGDKQPVTRQATIDASLVKVGKLVVRFDGEDVGGLSEALGIGVLSFSFSD